MTLKAIKNQIAAFTGDWKNAKNKARVFDDNCLIPLSDVTGVNLSFGKFSDGHCNYYGENKTVLNFDYTDKLKNRYHFAIYD